MVTQDIILLIKKIVVGIILFLVPIGIMGGILWLIQFFFFG